MNKVLILVYIPDIEQEYNVYIPINKKIGTIEKLLISSIVELSDGNVDNLDNYKLYDRDSGSLLNSNMIVKDSNIRNGSELILL